jgi:rhamnogalacturonan endolyase
VMHRDGIRGYWCERSVTFDGALLRQGTNTIQLHVPSNNWTQGVLYDYLRLEMQ